MTSRDQKLADALNAPTRRPATPHTDTDARILVIDIERLPGLAPIFDQRTRGFIPAASWHRLPSLLCYAAKWYGARRVEFLSVWDDGADAMTERAWQLYDAADVVVTYNGVRFDNRHLKSEWLLAGMAPPAPWRNVDLFTVNRRTFGFESKSLDHLCQRLGLQGKAGHYDQRDAEACVAGDETARRRMKRYNVRDVRITEQAYDALRPWITRHPHLAASPLACPNCGSTDLALQDRPHSAHALAYPAYRCGNCGANVRGRKSLARFSDTLGTTDAA